jgi:hypothetical protein
MQPKRELLASKSKEKQGKVLVFPWIPLVESGFSKGYGEKNKKIARRLNSPLRLRARHLKRSALSLPTPFEQPRF